MNKLLKFIISVLAGIEVVFYLITPIVISAILVVFSTNEITTTLINVGGLLATLYRGIKIGFLKE